VIPLDFLENRVTDNGSCMNVIGLPWTDEYGLNVGQNTCDRGANIFCKFHDLLTTFLSSNLAGLPGRDGLNCCCGRRKVGFATGLDGSKGTVDVPRSKFPLRSFLGDGVFDAEGVIRTLLSLPILLAG